MPISFNQFARSVGTKRKGNTRIMRYHSIKPLIVDAIQVSGPAEIPTRDGLLHASAGDWLVSDPQGNTKLCRDHFFRANFTAMPHSGTIQEFREPGSSGGC